MRCSGDFDTRSGVGRVPPLTTRTHDFASTTARVKQPTARRQAPLILEDIAALSVEQQPACSRGVGNAGETGDICT